MAYTGETVSRIYNNFRGVDLRGEETGLSRSPDALNVWRNYENLACIETRPGIKQVLDLEELTEYSHEIKKILQLKVSEYKNGRTVEKQRLVIVANYDILVETDDGWRKIYSTADISGFNEEYYHVRDGAFVFANTLYFSNGMRNYYKSNGISTELVTPYIPTTSIGRKPSGSGTIHEDVNMLTPKRKNTFLGDGESTDYYCDSQYIFSGVEVKVTVSNAPTGVSYTASVANNNDGKGAFVRITPAPPEPSTDGQDNVEITFSIEEYDGCISGIVQEFDNRIFFRDIHKKHRLRHSALNNPTYVSDLDYYDEGTDGEIADLVVGNNDLWVFKRGSSNGNNIYRHIPTLDEEYGKIYPSVHSNVPVECDGRAINFNGDILFFTRNGVEAIGGDITNEQFAVHRSSTIDRKLSEIYNTTTKFDENKGKESFEKMAFAELGGYLFAFIDKYVFLADSRALWNNEGRVEYEWYYWDLGALGGVRTAAYINGKIYFGGWYALDCFEEAVVDEIVGDEAEDGSYPVLIFPIESYWTTPKDKFNAPHKVKTTNKKGCVVEAIGNVDVYAKTDGDEAFDLIGSYTDVADYFTCKIKKKKFKDIQLKFYSQSRFRLESATLEAIIGGYIKD